ncbi:MAG: glycerol-3-phosphate 1-O-acyltransferase [Peptococcaceae bacterium]|nr:MAG: glycerol-3-phosphate 1-O-acyltransferase [Peptococcaceae bacterium]
MILLLIVAGYIVGSIPVGYLLARYVKGIDIRQYGSGNIGATNVWRIAGPALGILAFAGDFGKGVLPVLLAKKIGGADLVTITAVATLAGHSWPVFLGFKGGKIIATSFGVFFAIALPVAILCAGIWIVIVASFRYISLGSVLAIISLPLLMLFWGLEMPYILLGLFVAIVGLYKHLPNIKRLIMGTEPKIGRQKV